MATCESEPLPEGDPQASLIELVAPDEIVLGSKVKVQENLPEGTESALTVKDTTPLDEEKLVTDPSSPATMPRW